jgi:hypothetical protein
MSHEDPARLPRSCNCCGSNNVSVTQSYGAIDRGEFEEQWRCGDCNAKGWIEGEASNHPAQWRRKGALFR